MARIVFLDIDGVLTSRKSVRKFGHYRSFLPSSVGALNHILEYTGAQIVISSSWRVGRTLDDLREVFNQQGVVGSKIIDVTPAPMGVRGREIDSWLRITSVSVESFVIIDDGFDMENHVARLVRTTFEDGLNMLHADMAIRILTQSF